MLTYELWTKLTTSKCSSEELKESYIAFGVIVCEFLVSLLLAIYQNALAVIREHRKLGVQLFVIAGILNATVVSFHVLKVKTTINNILHFYLFLA